jgi:hypothetical protein
MVGVMVGTRGVIDCRNVVIGNALMKGISGGQVNLRARELDAMHLHLCLLSWPMLCQP